MMSSIADHYRHIQDDVISVAEYYGRKPAEITLIAILKGYGWEEGSCAYHAGCRHFGENRVQEALKKIASAPTDVCWHMVGNLQKNKVSKALGKFGLIHSVDTLELAV